MRLARLLQYIATAALVSGIGRSPAVAPAPAAAAEASSLVFVYAQRATPARSWLRLACDGKTVAGLKRGYFLALRLSPGRHTLSLTDGVPISVETSPARESFVRLAWSHDVRRPPIPVLTSVAEETARQEMRFLSYVEPKRIYSAAVSGADPRPDEKPGLKIRQR